jgi:hypothetical protein
MLGRTGITDQGLIHLTRLTNLQTLNLAGTKVTDNSLHYLEGLPLKELNVRGTQITSEAIARLKERIPVLQVIQ